MDNFMDKLPANLSANLINLRKSRGLSQVQLAQRAQIPRSTLTYLESGESNPSLQNLAKVSWALQVSIQELIGRPIQEDQLIKAQDVPLQNRLHVQIEKLLPDPIVGMEIDRMTFAGGGHLKGIPHTENTKEYLYCEKGAVRVHINKQQFDLSSGDIFSFRGDRPHTYENLHKVKKTICFSVVVLAQNYM